MKHPNGDEEANGNMNINAPRAGLERWHASEKLKLLKAYEPVPEPDWISEQRFARPAAKTSEALKSSQAQKHILLDEISHPAEKEETSN